MALAGGSIVFGGVAGPVALMYGPVASAASTASLLLNLEAVLTALLAWILFRGQALPSLGVLSLAMAVGSLGYGDSLVLFVLALRYLGTARVGAYFSVAPFFGAALAVLIHRTHINYRAALATAVSSGVDFGLCTVLRIRMSGGNRFLPP